MAYSRAFCFRKPNKEAGRLNLYFSNFYFSSFSVRHHRPRRFAWLALTVSAADDVNTCTKNEEYALFQYSNWKKLSLQVRRIFERTLCNNRKNTHEHRWLPARLHVPCPDPPYLRIPWCLSMNSLPWFFKLFFCFYMKNQCLHFFSPQPLNPTPTDDPCRGPT